MGSEAQRPTDMDRLTCIHFWACLPPGLAAPALPLLEWCAVRDGQACPSGRTTHASHVLCAAACEAACLLQLFRDHAFEAAWRAMEATEHYSQGGPCILAPVFR